ncbi:MAG: hypothetical protein HFH85_20415 [Lachnospiraceae bacterium]|nr:hypothetical protein [Lachnospiraceae bacterium]
MYRYLHLSQSRFQGGDYTAENTQAAGNLRDFLQWHGTEILFVLNHGLKKRQAETVLPPEQGNLLTGCHLMAQKGNHRHPGKVLCIHALLNRGPRDKENDVLHQPF